MKKIISMIVACIACSLLLAQTNETSFGIVASPTIGWMGSNDNLINSNGVKLGFKFGGVGEYYATDWMVLYGGAMFSFSQGGALLHKFGGNLLPDSDLSDSKIQHGRKTFA